MATYFPAPNMSMGTYTATSTAEDNWGIWDCPYKQDQTSMITWLMWNAAYSTLIPEAKFYPYSVGGIDSLQPFQPTPEALRLQQELLRQQEEARVLREAKAREARDRSEALLKATLNEEQKRDLETKKYFLVHTKRGIYRVEWGYAGNVKFLGKPGLQPSDSYCIHGPSDLPVPDQMLSQKLLLEADEEQFLRIANRTQL